jgi:hypothetical protein
MCRNIKTLYNFQPPATDEEIRASALQYVRKLSGFAQPSKANELAFARAIDEVTQASRALLDSLVTKAPPRDRELESGRQIPLPNGDRDRLASRGPTERISCALSRRPPEPALRASRPLDFPA